MFYISALTWNIKSGHYRDQDPRDKVGVENLTAVAQVIAHLKADVVCLQEVERGTARSQGIDQGNKVCQLLTSQTGKKWHCLFAPARAMNPGFFGNAIVSPYRFSSATRLHLPAIRGREARCFLGVRLKTSEGTVWIGTFHLGIRDEVEHASVIKQFLFNLESKAPILIGGDLNDEPGSPAYNIMTNDGCILYDGGPNTGKTFRCYDEERAARLDFWFHSEEVIPKTAEIIPIDISDHRPLLLRATVI